MDKAFISYSVEDRSFVAFIKRQIHNDLLQTDFSGGRIAEIDIIVSELTSNLVKHAGQGEILYRLVNRNGESTFEVLTIDHGPGIADVPRMMKDGVSTTNTLGQGLGAIQRLSDEFQVYSMPNWGTVTYTVVGDRRHRTKPVIGLDVRAVCVPKPREVVCGDGYAVRRTHDKCCVLLGDGLGHGEHANEAVRRATEIFMETDETNPVQLLRLMHENVRRTRGLVASVAVLDAGKMEWRICGVGNITTRLYGGLLFKHYMAYNGIVGLNIPNTMNESVIPAEKNQQLIMCSDGIRNRWDVTRYPAILKYDCMILAAVLYKDFNRGNDDASIFIGKIG